MSLKLPYEKIQTADEGFKLAKEMINEELTAKFKVKAQISHDDKQKKVVAKGSGFEISILFNPDHALVSLDLGLLYKPMRSVIMDGVEKQLKRFI